MCNQYGLQRRRPSTDLDVVYMTCKGALDMTSVSPFLTPLIKMPIGAFRVISYLLYKSAQPSKPHSLSHFPRSNRPLLKKTNIFI